MAAAPPDVTGSASLAELRDAAIVREPDRYFAATLAPAALRYDLVVLAAFAAEISRVRGQVREPLAGEIRLQWWRDALIGGSSEGAAGHPVAMAMRATMARFTLPATIVEGVIDAQADALHGERPMDESALRARLAASEGGVFRLATRICAGEETGEDTRTAEEAGLAYGLSRALAHSEEGLLLIPRSMVADEDLVPGGGTDASVKSALGALSRIAREAYVDVADQVRHLSRRQRLAFLPLVMVRPNLRALQRDTDQTRIRTGDVLPIRRLLRLGWAHASGRI